MTKLITGLVALLPMTMLACAGGEGTSSSPEADSGDSYVSEDLTLGASFKSPAGAKVDVYQDADGGLLVSIVAPAMSNETLAAYERREADLADLYLELTGNSQVPADVAAMNQILLESRKQLPPSDAQAVAAPAGGAEQRDLTSGPPRSPQGLTPRTLTTEQFVSGYCPRLSWDYAFCWPNMTGTRDHGQWCFSMDTYAYANSGTITHRIDRHLFGKWRTQLANNVPAGYLSSLSRLANGLQDNMRGGVWDADGDSYHLTVYGLR